MFCNTNLDQEMTYSILINTITQQKFLDKYSTYKSWTINSHANNQTITCGNQTKLSTKFNMTVDKNNIFEIYGTIWKFCKPCV